MSKTKHWKKDKPRHKQSYDGWTIGRSSNKTKIMKRGSWEYWVKTVRRINIFADTNLKPGNPIQVDVKQCIPDGKSRLKLALTYRKLQEMFKGKELFTREQAAEVERVFHGGYLVRDE